MSYKAVCLISRSCRPTIPISYLAQALGFTGASGQKESDGMEVCSEWLKALGASLISDSNGDMLLDTKSSGEKKESNSAKMKFITSCDLKGDQRR
ncbi:unnamed protein product [Brassica rapa]|uniref:Uncharacterized protein n=1 Tax=Brassica campestris TaxID=3711 RepID=A0A8D9GHM2_BRACM|nr:unnamed protein product [Brassica rapa]